MSQTQVRNSLPLFFLPLMAAVTAIAPFSIDAYLPAFPAMAEEFGVDPLQINLTMSAYLVGLAVGQLLGGPVSDQIGRKRVGMVGLAIFFLVTLVILFVSDLQQLVVLRGFQAIGGGLAASIVMPTVRDVSPPEKAASRIAIMMLFMLLAPLIAPVIGVLLLYFGWRYIFVFLCVYAGIAAIIYFFGIRETRPDARGKPDFAKIFGQYLQVIQHRLEGQQISIRYAMASAFASATMMIYLTNASFVLQTYYQVETRWFPVAFSVNVIAFALGQSFSARYLRDRSLQETAAYYRFGLKLQFFVMCLILITVLFFMPPLWLFLALLGVALGSIGLTGPSGSGLYLAAFGKLSGSAAAILTVGMFGIGSLIGGISTLFKTGDLIPLAIALFFASAIANILIVSISRKKETQILDKLASGEISTI